MKPTPPVALLPPAAAKLLQQAAQTPITSGNKIPRLVAIEKAIAQVQRQHPHLFRKDES